MATILTFSLILILLISPSSATNPTNQDLLAAIEEMQKASYFTFIFLLNMAPPDLIFSNITFLMPNDRVLSKTIDLTNTSISNFLFLHSIPSPLLFDHLQHIPSGSLIPTSKPEYMLTVSNNGRSNFFLNNVQIISPNICTAGSSIRCHGIDGVMQATMAPHRNSTVLPSPTPSCSKSTSPPPMLPFAPPMRGGIDLTPVAAPASSNSEKSGCSHQLSNGLSKLVVTLLVLIVV